MATKMVVICGPDNGRSFVLVPGTPLVIGRGAQTTTKFGDLHMSRVHCEVRWDGRTATVIDNSSTGGTFVNREQVSTRVLRDGDVLRVGETELRFDSDVADETTLPPAKPVARPAPAATPMPARPAAAPGVPQAPPLALPVARPVTPAAVAGKATALPPAAAQQARPATPLPPKPLEPTVKEVVLANRAGGRPVQAWIKQLHELAGKSFDRFQLIKVLGDGSSGVVFLALDSALNRQVALKLFRGEFGRDEKGRQRFVRGMTAAIRLSHENVVALYDAGLSTQHCWISMEYVPGESLVELLRRSDGKHQAWQQALLWAGHMGQALQFLHRNGVLHRNVLPNNILIRSGDLVAKLGDVMLAKAIEEDGEGVTASGELVGNIYYMAPERTDSNATVDGRSDLYSLGATLYTVVTGRRPSTGASMVEVITNIRRTPPEAPRLHNSSLPEPFERLLLKLLQKRPEDRYQSAAEFLKDVEKVRLSTAGSK